MEDNVEVQIQPQNTDKLIDQIQNIFLHEKSNIIDETIGENKINEDISETKQGMIHDDEEKHVISEDENENKLTIRAEIFYKEAQQYWKTIPPTIDGMLGGFSNINITDIRGSQDFLKEIFKMKPSPNKNIALDCGAGIVASKDCCFCILFILRNIFRYWTCHKTFAYSNIQYS